MLLSYFYLCFFGIFVNPYITNHSIESIKNLPEANCEIVIDAVNISLLQGCVFHASNQARKLAKLSLLAPANALMQAANTHANDMITLGFFNHINSKIKAHNTFVERIKLYGGAYGYVSENIAERKLYAINASDRYTKKVVADTLRFYNASTKKEIKKYTYWQLGEALVKQWYDSPKHKINMLDKNVTHLGVGVAIDTKTGNGVDFPIVRAVQNFAY